MGASTIRTNPSEELWKKEIRALLYGKRAYAVSRLGDGQEYVEVILAESTDQAEAMAAFRGALEAVVTEWQPTKPQVPGYVGRMLELIAAFQPLAGFPKLVGHIQQGRRFTEHDEYYEPKQNVPDVHLKALVALEGYFPAPPAEPEHGGEGYKSYVRIVREHLHDSDFAGYAVARLLELEILSASQREIQETFARHPEAVRGAVSHLIRTEGERAQTELPELYDQCLRDPRLERHFVAALTLVGAALIDHPDGFPVIRLRSGAFLVLHGENNAGYAVLRWGRLLIDADAVVDRVLAEHLA